MAKVTKEINREYEVITVALTAKNETEFAAIMALIDTDCYSEINPTGCPADCDTYFYDVIITEEKGDQTWAEAMSNIEEAYQHVKEVVKAYNENKKSKKSKVVEEVTTVEEIETTEQVESATLFSFQPQAELNHPMTFSVTVEITPEQEIEVGDTVTANHNGLAITGVVIDSNKTTLWVETADDIYTCKRENVQKGYNSVEETEPAIPQPTIQTNREGYTMAYYNTDTNPVDLSHNEWERDVNKHVQAYNSLKDLNTITVEQLYSLIQSNHKLWIKVINENPYKNEDMVLIELTLCYTNKQITCYINKKWYYEVRERMCAMT